MNSPAECSLRQMYCSSALAVIGEFNIVEILREAGPQVGEQYREVIHSLGQYSGLACQGHRCKSQNRQR